MIKLKANGKAFTFEDGATQEEMYEYIDNYFSSSTPTPEETQLPQETQQQAESIDSNIPSIDTDVQSPLEQADVSEKVDTPQNVEEPVQPELEDTNRSMWKEFWYGVDKSEADYEMGADRLAVAGVDSKALASTGMIAGLLLSKPYWVKPEGWEGWDKDTRKRYLKAEKDYELAEDYAEYMEKGKPDTWPMIAGDMVGSLLTPTTFIPLEFGAKVAISLGYGVKAAAKQALPQIGKVGAVSAAWAAEYNLLKQSMEEGNMSWGEFVVQTAVGGIAGAILGTGFGLTGLAYRTVKSKRAAYKRAKSNTGLSRYDAIEDEMFYAAQEVDPNLKGLEWDAAVKKRALSGMGLNDADLQDILQEEGLGILNIPTRKEVTDFHLSQQNKKPYDRLLSKLWSPFYNMNAQIQKISPKAYGLILKNSFATRTWQGEQHNIAEELFDIIDAGSSMRMKGKEFSADGWSNQWGDGGPVIGRLAYGQRDWVGARDDMMKLFPLEPDGTLHPQVKTGLAALNKLEAEFKRVENEAVSTGLFKKSDIVEGFYPQENINTRDMHAAMQSALDPKWHKQSRATMKASDGLDMKDGIPVANKRVKVKKDPLPTRLYIDKDVFARNLSGEIQDRTSLGLTSMVETARSKSKLKKYLETDSEGNVYIDTKKHFQADAREALYSYFRKTTDDIMLRKLVGVHGRAAGSHIKQTDFDVTGQLPKIGKDVDMNSLPTNAGKIDENLITTDELPVLTGKPSKKVAEKLRPYERGGEPQNLQELRIELGDLDPFNKALLSKFLKLRFIDAKKPSAKFWQTVREFTHLTTIANPESAMIQLGDGAMIGFKAGLMSGVRSATKHILRPDILLKHIPALKNNPKLTKLVSSQLDLHIRELSHDLESDGWLTKLLKESFTWSGWRKVDGKMKDVLSENDLTSIGKALTQDILPSQPTPKGWNQSKFKPRSPTKTLVGSKATQANREFMQKWSGMFGADEAWAMKSELIDVYETYVGFKMVNGKKVKIEGPTGTAAARDKMTMRTRMYLFMELNEIQPIDQGEMPPAVYEAGNSVGGEIFKMLYTLTSFTVKFYSTFHKHVVDEIVQGSIKAATKGNKGRKDANLKRGLYKLAYLYTALGGANVGISQTQHYLRHGETDPTLDSTEEYFWRMFKLNSKMIGWSWITDTEYESYAEKIANITTPIANELLVETGGQLVNNLADLKARPGTNQEWYKLMSRIPVFGGIMLHQTGPGSLIGPIAGSMGFDFIEKQKAAKHGNYLKKKAEFERNKMHDAEETRKRDNVKRIKSTERAFNKDVMMGGG